MLPPLLLLANCSCKKWARTQITLGAMCLATPTHTHTNIVSHQSGRYSRNFVHSLPSPLSFPAPSRPIPACKLIHLRVVAGLQRDLVIVSPLFPRVPSSSLLPQPSFMCRHPTLSLLWLSLAHHQQDQVLQQLLLRAANKVFECLPSSA